MSKLTGMLTKDELATLVASGAIETVLVVFTDHYGRFMGKRYDAEFFLADALAHGAHACDYLLTVDMEMNPTPGYRFANWERGYGDFHLVPDLSTLRVAAWLDKTAMVLCDVSNVRTHERVTVAPRSIVRKQLERAEKHGYSAMASSELEYYLFRDSFRDAAAKKYSALEPMGWYLEDYHMLQGAREEVFNAEVRRHLKNSGVPVENSKGEWGLGQHELNVRYADAVTSADRHTIYKNGVKEIAFLNGIAATFMAKPSEKDIGSSCHIHSSLIDAGSGASAFVDGHDETDVFRHYLGGVRARIRELALLIAPSVNSYKRYATESWAPTSISWGRDNRTCGFRIVGHGDARRVECRIPGADVNPYLGYAALLAAGLDGIENQSDPGPELIGNAYAAGEAEPFPSTLREAMDLWEGSAFARKAFGEDVWRHYLNYGRTEQRLFDEVVTDYERRRMFERG